jgi:hypothetical protein
MRSLRFQIRHPQGQVDVIDVEAERALVGSGAHCEIRLPIDQARVEHLRLDLGPAGVFGTALAFDPPPTLNGVPITQQPIPADGVLMIGATQIQLVIVDTEGVGGKAKSKQQSSPLSILLLAGISIAVGVLLFGGDADTNKVVPAPTAPELWGTAVAVACPQPAGANATAHGRERLVLAETHRERRPFFVADGVKAVTLFEEAAACLKGAEELRSKYAADSAVYLRQDLKRDYGKFQVRLARHLQTEEWDAARRDVHQLLEFTEAFPNDPFRRWLADQNHLLDRKIGTGTAK